MERELELWRTNDGDHVLVACRCRVCGVDHWPHIDRCPQCWGDDLIGVQLRGGVLHAFTTVHVAPPGFTAPLVVGYVDHDGGARVFGHIDLAPDERVLGAPVRVELSSRESDQAPFRFVRDTTR